ncbi:Helix-turn-helix domain protein [Nocardioides dokdonensis FR1436]|uniref:Helix-turn-helix domain protein n=1 Tax=Nocardioides dokdonensis FR1436 TaxID=1300347 RepID=A0A1A9GJC8_9ACTN|nr:helix-turn-helix domain-containing protein [Nocardioides dokdonensis]ANH38368.1 Helix-turn-helix domain protein [Nocardioides dokdonensis FR1436]
MDDDFAAAVTGVGALSDPTRRALYLHVVDQVDAVTREQAATACGVAVHTAKFHLDRLVEAGLLEVDQRRAPGRTGPGAGRPAKVYRRADREVSVSLPERSYDLAAHLLARAVEDAMATGTAVDVAVRAAARQHGVEAGGAASRAHPGGGRELERVAPVLAAQGYEPVEDPDGLRLRNCPFDQLVDEHLDLVCGMNEALVDGVLEGMSCSSLHAVLLPAPDLCCVRVRAR